MSQVYYSKFRDEITNRYAHAYCDKFFYKNFDYCSLGGLAEGSHEVIVSVEEVIDVVAEGDLGTAVLGEEHGVALLDGDGAELAVVEGAAGADSDDDAEVELLTLAAFGEEDTALGLGKGLGLLDEDAVHQGSKLLECDHIYGLGDF